MELVHILWPKKKNFNLSVAFHVGESFWSFKSIPSWSSLAINTPIKVVVTFFVVTKARIVCFTPYTYGFSEL